MIYLYHTSNVTWTNLYYSSSVSSLSGVGFFSLSTSQVSLERSPKGAVVLAVGLGADLLPPLLLQPLAYVAWDLRALSRLALPHL